MRGFGSVVIVATLGCALLASCGSGATKLKTVNASTSKPAAVNATAFQICLKRESYHVVSIQPRAASGSMLGAVLKILTGARGFIQNSDFVVVPGLPGQGYAVIGFFQGAKDATAFADTLLPIAQPSQAQEHSANVAWYAWKNIARTNEDVSSCAR